MSLRGVRDCSAATRTGRYPSLPAAAGDLPSGRLILALAMLSAHGGSNHAGLACEPLYYHQRRTPGFYVGAGRFSFLSLVYESFCAARKFAPQSEGCVN